MQVIPTDRGDGIDRQQYKQMLESVAFARLMNRVASELARQEETCIKADEQLRLLRAQGAVGALRTVMMLPDQILQEFTTN